MTLRVTVPGVTAIEVRDGDITVIASEPATVPTAAEIVAEPTATAFTITPELLEVTVATVVSLLVQVACWVTSLVVPSARVAVAVNGADTPLCMIV